MSVRKSAAATLQNGEGNAIIWSPGIEDKGKSVNEKMASSPRLKFQGGFHNLQVLLDKMNKATLELKEGKFDSHKGYECVQQLHSRLARLREHFHDNIGDVQTGLIEHVAFYASNPIVLGGMVKLTEVLGMAHVLMVQKDENIQYILDTQIDPLLKRFEKQQVALDAMSEELSFYRGQMNDALDKGQKYEQDLTMHLKEARDRMRSTMKQQVDKKILDLSTKNRELESKVKQLEYQNTKMRKNMMMNSTANNASMLSGAAANATILRSSMENTVSGNNNLTNSLEDELAGGNRKAVMLKKVLELETIVENAAPTLGSSSAGAGDDVGSDEQAMLLCPMIRDACNYLRTLVHMTAEEDDVLEPYAENEFLRPVEPSYLAPGGVADKLGNLNNAAGGVAESKFYLMGDDALDSKVGKKNTTATAGVKIGGTATYGAGEGKALWRGETQQGAPTPQAQGAFDLNASLATEGQHNLVDSSLEGSNAGGHPFGGPGPAQYLGQNGDETPLSSSDVFTAPRLG